MKPSNLKSVIAAGAAEITRLQNLINQAVLQRDASPRHRDAWNRACVEFHSRYDALAFPGGYKGAIDRILAGEPFAIEAAICFLEARPYFYHSGYMFSDIMRKVKRVPLSPEQAKRLQLVIERQELWKEKRLRQNTA